MIVVVVVVHGVKVLVGAGISEPALTALSLYVKLQPHCWLLSNVVASVI